MSTIFRDKVTAGAIAFNDPTAQPSGAVIWAIDTLEGWDETPDIEVVSVAVGANFDGEILGDNFPARGRHLTISGYVIAADRAAAEELHDVLMRDAFPRNADVKLTRYETIPKYVTGRVAGQRIIQRVGPSNFRWIVPLLTGDPSKYDADPPGNSSGTAGVAGQSTGGRSYPRTYPLTYTTVSSGADSNSVTLYNRGTADTFPIVTLRGPLGKGSWRISNDTYGEDIRFDVALTATDVLVINFREGTALLNGFPVTASITGDFWKVRPGINIIKLFGDFDPAAGFDAVIESAWE